MSMKTKIVKYDDGWDSQIKYYAKRFGKHVLSFLIAASVTYALSDGRFIVLIPFLEVAQKIAKEKGYWF